MYVVNLFIPVKPICTYSAVAHHILQVYVLYIYPGGLFVVIMCVQKGTACAVLWQLAVFLCRRYPRHTEVICKQSMDIMEFLTGKIPCTKLESD